jgi:hypothetical protein
MTLEAQKLVSLLSIKGGLVGEGWWKVKLEIIELWDVKGNGFTTGSRFEKLRVEEFFSVIFKGD